MSVAAHCYDTQSAGRTRPPGWLAASGTGQSTTHTTHSISRTYSPSWLTGSVRYRSVYNTHNTLNQQDVLALLADWQRQVQVSLQHTQHTQSAGRTRPPGWLAASGTGQSITHTTHSISRTYSPSWLTGSVRYRSVYNTHNTLNQQDVLALLADWQRQVQVSLQHTQHTQISRTYSPSWLTGSVRYRSVYNTHNTLNQQDVLALLADWQRQVQVSLQHTQHTQSAGRTRPPGWLAASGTGQSTTHTTHSNQQDVLALLADWQRQVQVSLQHTQHTQSAGRTRPPGWLAASGTGQSITHTTLGKTTNVSAWFPTAIKNTVANL